ncbi:hypothetical protein [Streptosporangium sp. NBC_01756]|uniref:hypothetical protein n=1 Tax=Streptosporangium sp. NBC_01756 TaxID=2975950 RepID=UPI002DDBE242|nr:hypothetical protein [Streptosporangium sp. NBC_01756]WSC87897.1 ABC transporter permease [Streptosporangium sp. NBC_01756]
MIWLTWRQHRAQILVTAGMLVALGLLLLGSAVEAVVYIADHAPPGCPGPAPACGELEVALGERYDAIYTIFGWLPLVAPALIGAFWGAPLLGREYERGTHRLAWTQSVSTGRWLAVKLAVLGGAVVTGGLALSLMVSLWRPIFRSGIDSAFGNIGVFNMVGVAPAAWWLYAFALGTLAGVLFRRTLPAMALVVAGIAVTMFTLFSLSDHYAEPARAVLSGTTVLEDSDARLTGSAWLDPVGKEVMSPPAGICPRRVDVGRSDRNQKTYENCLFGKGYRFVVYHHPPTRFWRFQWTDAAVLTALSLVFGGVAVHRTLRRKV